MNLKKIAIKFLLIFFKKNKNNFFEIKNIKKILIIEHSRIGDAILTLPFLKELRRIFPEVKIDVSCGEWAEKIFENQQNINQIIIYNHPFARRAKENFLKELLCFIGLIFKFRRNKYDLSFGMIGNFGYMLPNLLSGAKFKIGMNNSNYLTSYIYSSSDISNYEVLNKLNLLKFFDSKIIFSGYDIKIIESMRIKKEFLSGDPIIVIHPVTDSWMRNWGIDNYQELIKKIILNFKLKVILIGGENDRNEAQKLIIKNQMRIINLAGKLNISETMTLIKNAILFIGQDSFPMHLASALETPIIALMGPGEYPRFAPYNSFSWQKIIRHQVCEYQKNNNCDQILNSKKCFNGENICMQAIKVDHVWKEVNNFLNNIAFASQRL